MHPRDGTYLDKVCHLHRSNLRYYKYIQIKHILLECWFMHKCCDSDSVKVNFGYYKTDHISFKTTAAQRLSTLRSIID
jgi:hypothetical protein